jgi:hypothetical protein
LRIGDKIPNLTLDRLGGEPMPLRNLYGQPAVIATYSSSCEPCHRMLPVLVEIVRLVNDKAHAAVPLIVIAMEGEVEAETNLRLGSQVTWLLDTDGSAQYAFDPQILPCTFLTDASATVRKINRGFGPGYEQRVTKWLEALVTP